MTDSLRDDAAWRATARPGRLACAAACGLLALAMGGCDDDDDGDDDGAGDTSAATGSADDGDDDDGAEETGDEAECVLEWSGDAMGTAPCRGTTADLLLGIQSADTVHWLAAADTDAHHVNFEFALAKPPTVGTHEGTEADDQFCVVGVTTTDYTGTWTASSRPLASGALVGSCAITFTSVVDDSSSTSSRFVVHGSATATLSREADPSAHVEVTVTF